MSSCSKIIIRKEGCSQTEIDHIFNYSIVLPIITYMGLSVCGAADSQLTTIQCLLFLPMQAGLEPTTFRSHLSVHIQIALDLDRS